MRPAWACALLCACGHATPAPISAGAGAAVADAPIADTQPAADAAPPQEATAAAIQDAAVAESAPVEKDAAAVADAAKPMDALAIADTATACDPAAKPQPNAALGAEPVGLNGCPAGMQKIAQGAAKPYCVDRWEAALQEKVAGQWQEHSPYWNPATTEIRAISRPNQVPQGYISGKQALQACQNAGKRLCTDKEWLRACQGPAGTTYPYGNTLKPKVCNDSRAVHPAIEYFGTSASWIWSKLGHPCINQLPKSEAKSGEYAGCVSAEGLNDLMGNLHEWTADPAGTFRGGYYADTKINGPGCLYVTTAHDMGHWDYSTGFRCCADFP